MISTPGSGKWVFAVVIAILLAVGWAFPTQTFFVLKFTRDLIVMNLRDLFNSIAQQIHHH
jgi:hypothetical protein